VARWRLTIAGLAAGSAMAKGSATAGQEQGGGTTARRDGAEKWRCGLGMEESSLGARGSYTTRLGFLGQHDHLWRLCPCWDTWSASARTSRGRGQARTGLLLGVAAVAALGRSRP